MFGFWKNQSGNIALMAGVALLPITVLAGSAIDMANVIADRSRIQHALDIAALDTAKRVGDLPAFADNEADVIEFATASFFANYGTAVKVDANTVRKLDSSVTVDLSHSLNKSNGVVKEVQLFANGAHKSHFMKIMLGDAPLQTSTDAAAIVRNDTFDVVMVLDNSGSMGGTKISTLRTAATDLTNILMGINTSGGATDRVMMGLVPFTAYVNVGAGNKNAAWMDTTGQSPVHSENFDQPANRFDLFDELTDVSWQGCVEARPYPHDVKDTAADIATPATLFVPQFSPDEPDGDNDNGMTYYNSYLNDEGGTCPGRAPSGSDRPIISQSRICKYNSVTPSSSVRNSNGVSSGPNYYCTTQQIQPLTNNKQTVLSSIASMDANGLTNIHAGIMWGWRTLSKAEPFTESRPDDKDDHNKVMILMTDGDNYYGFTSNNHNKSYYGGAYGYPSLNRIEANPLSSSAWLSKSNSRTSEACSNAKTDDGILIYSIAFKLNNPTTVDMLRNCATRPEMFFSSDSNQELKNAFLEIAESISKLRLTQ